MPHHATYIIAEAGVNHNGQYELATQLIDVAVKAGADAVKFQSFKADKLVSRTAPKAAYQQRNTDAAESQYGMLKRLELSLDEHFSLKAYCEQQGIQFLSTPFDAASVDLLVQEIQVPRLKLSSADLTNAPLLLKAAQTGLPIIVSTGMANIAEIETALGVLAFGYQVLPDTPPSIRAFEQAYQTPAAQIVLQEKVTLLHCTTEYPTPYHDVNLAAMDTLQQVFQLPVGLSDHTAGITIPIAAVARGAQLLEKHFTLDRTLPGPDHRASLEPAELAAMVQGIRQTEQAIGTGRKHPAPSELGNRQVARRSLAAAQPIQRGDVFTEMNLTTKRPAEGIAPLYYWDYLGQVAERDYAEDELI